MTSLKTNCTQKDGRDRIRTSDLFLAKETRYQLRYTPRCCRFGGPTKPVVSIFVDLMVQLVPNDSNVLLKID